jgi:hypothetical protein
MTFRHFVAELMDLKVLEVLPEPLCLIFAA